MPLIKPLFLLYHSLTLTCNNDIHQLIQQTTVHVENVCVAVAPLLLELDLYVESFANIAEANMVTFAMIFSLSIVSGVISFTMINSSKYMLYLINRI